MLWYLLPIIGFATGAVGTLVGAGGGFLLVPVLLLLYPNDPPEVITRISLTVVFFNALSGTIAYARQGRVDYRAGLIFASGTIPGAILGALATRLLERESFDLILGLFLAAMAAIIIIRPTPPIRARTQRKGETRHTLRDAQGHTYIYSFRASLGVLVSLGVGFVSSLFGIGGGIVHVPVLIMLLNFPTHIATATSHFMLTIMGLTGVLTHLTAGDIGEGWRRAAVLAAGVVAGAPLGARLSLRLRGDLIARLLGLGLATLAVRLVIAGLMG